MKNLRSVSTTSIPNDGLDLSRERVSNFNLGIIRSSMMEKIGLRNERFSYQEVKTSLHHLITPQILFKAFTYLLGFIWLVTIILTVF